MVPETQQQHYRGVLCLHCGKPIPISPLVASREAEMPGNETTTSREQKCQVFNLRCAACGKEKPYKTSEIRKFPGAAKESPNAIPTAARTSQLGNKSKAANA